MCWIWRRTSSEFGLAFCRFRLPPQISRTGIRTGQHKENNPVDHQDRPEHRDIEDGEPRANEADKNGASGRVPELELGETADERTEFVVLLHGQAGSGGVAVFQTLILRQGGVELGLQEEEEEVEQVDAEGVGHDVPSLGEDDSQEEDEEQDDGAGPAVGCEWGGGVEVGLVLLCEVLVSLSCHVMVRGLVLSAGVADGHVVCAGCRIATDTVKKGPKGSTDTYPSQLRGLRRHGRERRLLRLRNVHGGNVDVAINRVARRREESEKRRYEKADKKAPSRLSA